jgi:uncharacterized membrane protein YhaH (DUF805 family)
MFKTWTEQMLNVFKNTADFKGRTNLKSCVYAMLFQLVAISLVVLFISASNLVELGLVINILGFMLWGYTLLSSVSFTALLSRRLNDIGVHPGLFILSLWFTYLVVILFRIFTFFNNALNFFLPVMIYFIFHFFTIMMVMMPSKEE